MASGQGVIAIRCSSRLRHVAPRREASNATGKLWCNGRGTPTNNSGKVVKMKMTLQQTAISCPCPNIFFVTRFLAFGAPVNNGFSMHAGHAFASGSTPSDNEDFRSGDELT